MRTDDQFVPHVVTGIAKKCPQNSSLQFDVLLPLKVPPGSEHGEQSWGSLFLNTYLLLNPHADINSIEAKMTQIFVDDAPQMVKIMKEHSHGKLNGSFMLQLLFTDIHLNNNMTDMILQAQATGYMLIYFQYRFYSADSLYQFCNFTIARSIKEQKKLVSVK
jgi:putative ABC transport system permease protein